MAIGISLNKSQIQNTRHAQCWMLRPDPIHGWQKKYKQARLEPEIRKAGEKMMYPDLAARIEAAYDGSGRISLGPRLPNFHPP